MRKLAAVLLVGLLAGCGAKTEPIPVSAPRPPAVSAAEAAERFLRIDDVGLAGHRFVFFSAETLVSMFEDWGGEGTGYRCHSGDVSEALYWGLILDQEQEDPDGFVSALAVEVANCPTRTADSIAAAIEHGIAKSYVHLLPSNLRKVLGEMIDAAG